MLLDLANEHGLPDALALAEDIMRSAPAVPSRYDRGQLAEAQASAGNVGDAEKTLAALGTGGGWMSPSVDVIAVLAKRGKSQLGAGGRLRSRRLWTRSR